MGVPPISNAVNFTPPTATGEAPTPQLSAAQRGDVAGGRAAVVEGQVISLDRNGAAATAANAQNWGQSPAGSPERAAFDQTAQRLGTTDPARIAGDIGRQLGVTSVTGGGAGAPAPGSAISPASQAGASAQQGIGTPPGAVPTALGAVTNSIVGTVNGFLGNRRSGVSGAFNGLASPGTTSAVGRAIGSLGQGLPTTPGGLGGVAGAVLGLPQGAAPGQNAAAGLGAFANQTLGAAPVATLARDNTAGGAVSLVRGEAALSAGRSADAGLLALGVPREGLCGALGALAMLPTGQSSVAGAIAPSAGRALAQEALLARMATMFAPSGQGMRGGEPGSWMGLSAALAARTAPGDAATLAYQRAAAEAGADPARLARQPDGAPIFSPYETLRAYEDHDDPAAATMGSEAAGPACRCDSRPPEIIFATGFEAAPAAGDVVAQADATVVAALIPLANAGAQQIARGHEDPIVLRRVGGIDVTRSLGSEIPARDLDLAGIAPAHGPAAAARTQPA